MLGMGGTGVGDERVRCWGWEGQVLGMRRPDFGMRTTDFVKYWCAFGVHCISGTDEMSSDRDDHTSNGVVLC